MNFEKASQDCVAAGRGLNPRRLAHRKRWSAAFAAIGSATFLSWFCYRHVIPAGVGPSDVCPYLFYSTDRGILVSPNSVSSVAVYSNDAGAMHSGHYYTWFIAKRWWGNEVVAQGYLVSGSENVPVIWDGDKAFYVHLAKGRYGPEMATLHVDL